MKMALGVLLDQRLPVFYKTDVCKEKQQKIELEEISRVLSSPLQIKITQNNKYLVAQTDLQNIQ